MNFILDSIGFSEEVREGIETSRRLFLKEEKSRRFLKPLNSVLTDNTVTPDAFAGRLRETAASSLLKDETFFLLFYLENLKKLLTEYKKANIPEEIFYNTVKDFICKVKECYEMKGVLGIQSPRWYPRIFRLNLFGLGRFQYEYGEFIKPAFKAGDITIETGSPVLNMHIPSCGSMDKSARLDSYRRAYRFYKDRGYFTDKIMKATCHTWMLYPPYKEFFRPDSNIAGFAEEFNLAGETELPDFTDGWRIFGKSYGSPLENLPAETSLQRGFINYLKNSSKYGLGYGVLLFDGQNIIKY